MDRGTMPQRRQACKSVASPGLTHPGDARIRWVAAESDTGMRVWHAHAMMYVLSVFILVLLANSPTAGRWVGVVLLTLYARRRGWW